MKKRSFIFSFSCLFCVFFLPRLVFAELLNRGLEKYRSGDLEGAISDFEKVISTAEESPKAKELAKDWLLNCLIDAGNKYFQAGDHQKALSFLEKASNLAPENSEVKNLQTKIKEKTAVPPPPVPVAPQSPVKEEIPKVEKPVEEKPKEIKPPAKKEETAQPAVVPQIPIKKEEPAPAEQLQKVEKKKLKKTTVLITEIPIPKLQKPEAQKAPWGDTLQMKLNTLEEKIGNFVQSQEEEKRELNLRLEKMNKTFRQIILYVLLIFLSLVLFFPYVLRVSLEKTILRNVKAILPIEQSKTSQDIHQVFLNWLTTLNNKEIIQIIATLLVSPEKNAREKGFEFLEKAMKVRKFSIDEQWKIERTIRKIGLEEGWVMK